MSMAKSRRTDDDEKENKFDEHKEVDVSEDILDVLDSEDDEDDPLMAEDETEDRWE